MVNKLASVRFWLIILGVLGALKLTPLLSSAITRNALAFNIIHCVNPTLTDVPFVSNFQSQPTREVVVLPAFELARPDCESKLATERQIVQSNTASTTELWTYVLGNANPAARPDTPDYMSNLWRGYSAALIGDWPTATQSWQQIEGFDEYLSQRARFLTHTGNLNQAKATLLMGLEVLPDNAHILYTMADLLYEDSLIGDNVVARLERVETPSARLRFTQARQMIVEGKYMLAERLLRDAIAWDSTNFYYYEALGHTLLQTGKPGDAAETLEHALKLSATEQDYLWAILELGAAYTATGNVASARQAYSRITLDSPLFSTAQKALEALPVVP